MPASSGRTPSYSSTRSTCPGLSQKPWRRSRSASSPARGGPEAPAQRLALGHPWQPGPVPAPPFSLWNGDEEHRPSAAPLRQRLGAKKMARLQRVKTTLDQAEARGAIAGAAAKAARELLSLPHVNALVVVVNRVDTARETWRSLQAMSWAEAPLARGPETVLLTGRMRPLERDALVGELTGRVSAGRSRGDYVAPLVVVATQCIEAGADYDFDALVTECASLDALRQRFGRLDRLGELSAAGTPAQGVVLGPSSTVAKGADDPVYGAAIPPTWAFLHDSETEGVVDFGCSAPAGHEPPPEGTLSRLKVAPHLLPREVECWVETPLPPLASALGCARCGALSSRRRPGNGRRPGGVARRPERGAPGRQGRGRCVEHRSRHRRFLPSPRPRSHASTDQRTTGLACTAPPGGGLRRRRCQDRPG